MRRALIATLVVSAVVAGCGSSSDGEAGKVLFHAADQTSKLRGAHLDLSMRVAGQEITMTGFQDFAGKRGRFTMTLPEVGDVDMVSDGELYYFRFPEEVRDGLNADTEWVSADADAAGANLFGNSSGFDAAQLLRQLSAAGDVSEAGTETGADGTKLRKYHAVVDLGEVPKTLPEDQRADAEKVLQEAVDQGLELETPMDIWVDEDSHVRKLTEQLELGSQTIDVTLDLSDFGTHETIQVPDKATDITDQLD